MDKICIKDLEVFANHGVKDEEQSLGQKFLVSCRLDVDISRAAASDDLHQTVNYGAVCRFISEWMSKYTYKLIESVAQRLSCAILDVYPLVEGVELEIKKPWAPVAMPIDTVSVQTERSWHKVYIAIGSNMGDKENHIEEAVKMLDSESSIRFLKMAPVISTKPYGGVEQDDFLNSAISLETYLRPYELLDKLHEIEAKEGRERKIHWGPRTLDLDILIYDDLVMDEPDLTIPHADMEHRTFVLEPLCEIAPNLIHPVSRKTVRQMLTELEKS